MSRTEDDTPTSQKGKLFIMSKIDTVTDNQEQIVKYNTREMWKVSKFGNT